MAKRKSVKTSIRIDPRVLFAYAESFREAVKMVLPQYQRYAMTPIPPEGLNVRIAPDMAPTLTLDTFAWKST